MFTDEEISRFQILYQKHFGVSLSKDEATKYGAELIQFLQAVIGHPTNPLKNEN